MPRRRAAFISGGFHHVYRRGNPRQAVFFERENYFFFLRRMRRYLLPACDVAAYCLMPNHCHLLVRIADDGFSKAMQSFGQSFTNAVNRRYGRTGSLFEGRFQAKAVDQEAYHLHLSRYVHLNPVAAKLVERAEDGEFSSCRDCFGVRNGTLPSPELVLRGVGSREEYRSFVLRGMSEGRDRRIEHLAFEREP